jgi:hypothetical protein
MKVKLQRSTFLAIVLGGVLVWGGCVATQEGESKPRDTKTLQTAEGSSKSTKPGKIKPSKDTGGYVLVLEGVDKKNFSKTDVSKAMPPNASVVIGEQAERLPVKLSEPQYDPASMTLTYKLEGLQDSTLSKLPSDGSSVHVLGDCPDGNVACYGGYQCGGGQCCQVECGDLGITVGYCWDWWTLSCNPCQDYSAQCNSQICNSSNSNFAYCRLGNCGDTQTCYSDG